MLLLFTEVKGAHLEGRNGISRYDDPVLLTPKLSKHGEALDEPKAA